VSSNEKRTFPALPTECFCRHPAALCTETLVKKACDHPEYFLLPSRNGHLTKPLNGRARATTARMRTRMHQRLQLQFQPGDDSAATGHWGGFTLIWPMPWLAEIVVNKDGQTQAAPTSTKRRTRKCAIHARAFVVARERLRIARLLLNSRSTLFPNGLAIHPGWSAAT